MRHILSALFISVSLISASAYAANPTPTPATTASTNTTEQWEYLVLSYKTPFLRVDIT